MFRRGATRRTLDRSLQATVLGAVLLVVVACGSTSATASPTARPTAAPQPTPTATPAASIDVGQVYATIEEQVITLRGLRPNTTVERQVISESELRTMLTQQFDEETPPEYLAANERLYKALGLMAPDQSLRDLSLDMLTGGVAGFYRDDQGKLYVVSRSGALGGNEKITYAHEYDHALQDQNFTVFKDQKDVLDRSDWIMARQAVYEGDATILMSLWALPNLSPEELQEIVAAGSDPEQAALLERMPAIMRETLLFPYTTGALFVQGIQAQGGWAAVDGMYGRLPESTEQILHPEKYAVAEAPIQVSLPSDLATRLGDGWSVPLEDTFGEMQTGVWLREGGVAPDLAADAAAGWGGDRLVVIAGPDDAWAVAWQTVWDSEADAQAFETAAATALATAAGHGQVLPGAGGTTRWIVIGSDTATSGRVATALGLAG